MMTKEDNSPPLIKTSACSLPGRCNKSCIRHPFLPLPHLLPSLLPCLALEGAVLDSLRTHAGWTNWSTAFIPQLGRFNGTKMPYCFRRLSLALKTCPCGMATSKDSQEICSSLSYYMREKCKMSLFTLDNHFQKKPWKQILLETPWESIILHLYNYPTYFPQSL